MGMGIGATPPQARRPGGVQMRAAVQPRQPVALQGLNLMQMQGLPGYGQPQQQGRMVDFMRMQGTPGYGQPQQQGRRLSFEQMIGLPGFGGNR